MSDVEIGLREALAARALLGGALAPVDAFVGSEDLAASLATWRRKDGSPCPLPPLLPSDAPVAAGDEVVLRSGERPVALLEVAEVFRFDREALARGLLGTTDPAHPGAARILAGPDRFLAGRPRPVERGPPGGPAEVRRAIRSRGWGTVAGFQTRNPPHRGHERLVREALARVDGVLVQPVVGPTRRGDAAPDAVVDAWAAVLAEYLPRDRALLAPLAVPMLFAGPREAVHHAILRRNHGCTHFVVGRDHAGAGAAGRAAPDDAIAVFARFPDLGIEILPYHGAFFHCRACGELVTERTCPHPPALRVEVSGTLLREWAREGRDAPREVVRPEVLRVLAKHPAPFVEVDA